MINSAMVNIRKLRAWRDEVNIPGLEIARLSRAPRIGYASLSLFETGNAKPTDRQLDAIQKALVKAIELRIKKLASVIQKIEQFKEIDQVADEAVGARSSGGDERPDAPGPTQ